MLKKCRWSDLKKMKVKDHNYPQLKGNLKETIKSDERNYERSIIYDH